ncbi:MAG: hypothetical protein JNK05_11625 [Myxococcales bacterium]|nr:hypothetical protein [Myxococcales bacterium]
MNPMPLRGRTISASPEKARDGFARGVAERISLGFAEATHDAIDGERRDPLTSAILADLDAMTLTPSPKTPSAFEPSSHRLCGQ